MKTLIWSRSSSLAHARTHTVGSPYSRPLSTPTTRSTCDFTRRAGAPMTTMTLSASLRFSFFCCLFIAATWRCNRGDGVGLLALESAPRALQIWFAWCCSDTDRILNCTNAMRTEARGGDRRRCPFAHGIDLGAAGVAAAVIQIRAERSEVASVTMTVTAMTISGLWIVPK